MYRKKITHHTQVECILEMPSFNIQKVINAIQHIKRIKEKKTHVIFNRFKAWAYKVYTNTKGYCSVITWNEAPVQAKIWINLKNIERNLTQKRIKHKNLFQNFRTGKLIHSEERSD